MECTGSREADGYAAAMRRILVAASVVLAPLLVAAPGAGAAIDECALLTDAQAESIMQTEPYSAGSEDNGGCSWETDPSDRANGIAYVVLKVEKRKTLLADYGNDLQTYLDESTNVGIDALPGIGDEAFSIYAPLTGPGASSGIEVAVGKRIVSISYQPAERVENPSPEFDKIVKIVKKVVAKVRKG